MYKNQIYSWAKDLFPINRSLTGHGNITTLKYIKKIVPILKIINFKSGKKVFDWIVPKVWNVSKAYIQDRTGKKIIDFKKNNLHVVGYSSYVNKTVPLHELRKHLHFIKDQPNAIPYITSYYNDYWGFCVSYNQFRKMKKNRYKVLIDSKLTKGNLNIGEIFIKGSSDKEILLSTNICHPSMGNNELSGIVVTTAIAKFLYNNDKNYYSYRILFLPETIGSIAYLSKNYKILKKRVIGGLNIVCVGTNTSFSFLPSKYEDTITDKICLHVLKHYSKNFKKYTFLDRGSDERQYCSPGIELPICSVMRSKYGTYKEYHTSLDNLNFIKAKGLNSSYEMILKIINCFEINKKYKTTFFCEPKLGKYNLYHLLSDKKNYASSSLYKDILTYCDGKNDLVDIANLLNRNVFEVYNSIKVLKKNNLISISRN